MKRVILCAVLVLGTPAAAQVPLPREKPDTAAPNAVPVPMPRPDPPAAEAVPSQPPVEPPPPLSDEAFATCTRALTEAGARFEPAADIVEGACQASRPVRMTHAPGNVALAPSAVLLCPAALAFATWVSADVAPMAQTHFGKPLREIRGGTGYECRNRNRADVGRLSEHAFANAADVSAFVLVDGTTIEVRAADPEPTAASRFLDDVRKAACRHFTTVLGPGEPSHDTHLHVDVRQRRGGFRLCQ